MMNLALTRKSGPPVSTLHQVPPVGNALYEDLSTLHQVSPVGNALYEHLSTLHQVSPVGNALYEDLSTLHQVSPVGNALYEDGPRDGEVRCGCGGRVERKVVHSDR